MGKFLTARQKSDVKKGLAIGGAAGALPLAFSFLGAATPRSDQAPEEKTAIRLTAPMPENNKAAPPTSLAQNFTTSVYDQPQGFNILHVRAQQDQQVESAKQNEQTYDRFIDHLMLREGKRNKVYKDSEGHLTVGVGHLVTDEDNLKLGDKISDEKVKELLRKDAQKAFRAAKEQAAEAGIESPDFIIALGSVNFQLGTGWRGKFKKTWELIKDGQYEEAANRLNKTKWNAQTPVRVQDFQTALRDLAGKALSFHPRIAEAKPLGYAFNGAAIADPYDIDLDEEIAAIDIGSYQTNGASVLRLEVA